MGYLIDSNVLIDYVSERFNIRQLVALDDIFDKELSISVITKIETLGFNAPSEEENKMLQFISLANIIALTDDIVQRTIGIRKTVKIKTPDAIIAATALAYNLTLLTKNADDFKNIPGLKCTDPYVLL